MIDIFTHITPPKYLEALQKKVPNNILAAGFSAAFPTLADLDTRFRIMDKYEGLKQVLSLAPPAVESISNPKDAVELAEIANDEMAELVTKYPDRFAAAVACLPMSDMDATLRETDRAINQLKFRGVQLYTDIAGKPLDSPEFMPLYEKMANYDLPILLHPQTGTKISIYANETEPKYLVPVIFGWPFQTTAAMTYLVGGGVFERYPTLKVVAHHCGAMIPFFAERITLVNNTFRTRLNYSYEQHLSKPIIDYFRMFYADTAIHGNVSALMCAYNFFGADHILFGTDMPYCSQIGDICIGQTIPFIEQMDIPQSDKKKIFEDNAIRLLTSSNLDK